MRSANINHFGRVSPNPFVEIRSFREAEYARQRTTEYTNTYISTMQEFLQSNYGEAIRVHNERAVELRRERDEREQRRSHEMRVLLANGVSGNARWLAFQRDFDPLMILNLISQSRNNFDARNRLQQIGANITERHREIQPLSEEQSEWYTAINVYVFVPIIMAANLGNPNAHDARQMANAKLRGLADIRMRN